jgi:hypothetical protein
VLPFAFLVDGEWDSIAARYQRSLSPCAIYASAFWLLNGEDQDAKGEQKRACAVPAKLALEWKGWARFRFAHPCISAIPYAGIVP